MGNTGTHSGFVDLCCSFDQAWEFINKSREDTELVTAKGRRFIVQAKIARRKETSETERVLIFLYEKPSKKWAEAARCFPCCWGFQTNCYGRDGQRVGMYCEALDSRISQNE